MDFGVRVLHVVPAVAERYGGPSFAIRSMCDELDHIPGMQIEVATTDADGRTGNLDLEALQFPVPVHVFPRTFSESWKYSNQLGRWLNRHAKEYDLIHLHAAWSYSVSAAASAARRAGVPYVLRPAGMLSPYGRHHRSLKKRLYWQLIERKTAHHAAAVHTTSSVEAKEIRSLLPDANVFVIPNGIDKQAWSVETNRMLIREQVGMNVNDRPIILFLSRLHPKKGIIDILLPAFAKIRDRAFLVIAGGPDYHTPGFLRQIMSVVGQLGLNDDVRLVGPVAGESRWHFFDGADAFVLPSHSENFGIVVGEAMARACPVVVSENVQSSEHVLAGNAGHVVPLRPELVSHALAQILEANESNSFGRSGRDYALKHLKWSILAHEIQNMYRQVVIRAA